jgi:uncharacterized membrane protein YfcA
MTEIITILLVFFIGVLASMFGSMIGGGTLLSLPLLMLLGIPPQVAVATERLGGIGQTLAAFGKFAYSKKIVWKYVLLLATISILGSIIGANILVSFDPGQLQKAIGLILVILVPITLLRPQLGTEHNSPSGAKIIVGSIIYFLVQIFAAFFGGGTGILTSYTLMSFFGLTILESTATKIIPWFMLSIVSLVIFAKNQLIDYKVGVVLFVGMTIGGYLGAHIAISKGDIWVKKVFYLLVAVTIGKLLIG